MTHPRGAGPGAGRRAPVLRRAGADDAGPLLALVHAAYRDEDGGGGWTSEAGLIDGSRTTPGLLAADLADPEKTVLLAVDAADLVGCAIVTLAPGSATASFGTFAVRPGLQGGGVGSMLLAAAEAHARDGGATTMAMTVLAPRTDLQAWYLRRGYAPTGERVPFPYGDVRYGRPRRDDLDFLVLTRALALPE